MDQPFRKVLNLTYSWLFELIGGTDEWKRDFEHIFDDSQHEDFDYVDLPQTTGGGLILGGI